MDVEELSQYKAPQEPAPAPITPSPVSPQGGHRWGLLGVFFVLALGLSAVAYFFLSDKYAAEPVIPLYTPRETAADLKTYTNTEYGFEFKYPSEFIINSQYIQPDEFHPGKDVVWIQFEKDGQKIHQIALNDHTGDSNLSEYRSESERITLNNLDILKNRLYEKGSSEASLVSVFYFFEGNGNQFSIKTEAKNERLFDQILSTFKFTTPVDTSTWKTYRNTRYGFELKYPAQWSLAEEGIQSGGTSIDFENAIVTAQEVPVAGSIGCAQGSQKIGTFAFSTGSISDKCQHNDQDNWTVGTGDVRPGAVLITNFTCLKSQQNNAICEAMLRSLKFTK